MPPSIAGRQAVTPVEVSASITDAQRKRAGQLELVVHLIPQTPGSVGLPPPPGSITHQSPLLQSPFCAQFTQLSPIGTPPVVEPPVVLEVVVPPVVLEVVVPPVVLEVVAPLVVLEVVAPLVVLEVVAPLVVLEVVGAQDPVFG